MDGLLDQRGTKTFDVETGMTDYNLYGCSDHGCIYGHPGGMGTNGGCRCRRELQRSGEEGRKAVRQIQLLRDDIKELQARFAEALAIIENSFPPERGFGKWDSDEWWQRRDALLKRSRDGKLVQNAE